MLSAILVHFLKNDIIFLHKKLQKDGNDDAEIRNPVLRRGRDFTKAEKHYMIDCLQPERGDQHGHIIAATLGGRNQLYNLFPQHPAVNMNRGVARDHQNYWFNNDMAMKSFLKSGPDNRIYLEVRLQYA
ncbi:unnamed protein product [Allacma fusca]|uniref:Uncharacterized protein n=1 Tax=Allacma fusca TaxID=39272 RepID=A0A8J2KE83_9HEXA|nr:unnamed protein product [Allacma fusca]